jgi:hypothetical protein
MGGESGEGLVAILISASRGPAESEHSTAQPRKVGNCRVPGRDCQSRTLPNLFQRKGNTP